MKKALAMLLTLAMLFSCLVVGVAEEAIPTPPAKLEDCGDSWTTAWESTWEDGTVYTTVRNGHVNAYYLNGVLNSYGYSVEVEGGIVSGDFTADHRQTATSYYNYEKNQTYTSYNGGKTWVTYDEETWTEVKTELPEGVEVEPLPALGEYVYIKPVVADKLEDVDLENGTVHEYEWGIVYEGKNMSAQYDENGLLQSYSYWNEDHTIEAYFDYKHKAYSYTYADGNDWYSSVDGETWTKWDEATQSSVVVELPEYAEFEKLPAMGEYVYAVNEPALKLDVENVTEGRLNIWTDEEGNVTGYQHELGEVWANYNADGQLTSYYYDNEDGSQRVWYDATHHVTEIGLRTETGNWIYSTDGGETWGSWVWDEEAGESNWTETELPEGTVVEEMPPLGEPVEFEMLPVQNIEDVDTRFGDIYDLVDGEGNPTGEKLFNADHMSMYFDAEGKLTEYSYSNENYSQYVSYTADNELIYIDYYTEDGKNYFYWAANDTWSEYIYDVENDEWTVIDLEALPEGVEIDVLPPLGDAKPEVKAVWYPNNTMGVVGLSLRDTFPGLTNKWYNVVPVDISVDGTTTIPLVASNLFFISNAYVTVAGDSVTVTYDALPYHGNGWIEDECVAWFTSIDQITSDWLENPVSDLAFGQEISRANDLGNAEIALLFICNHVTYRQPFYNNGVELARYWPNMPMWKDYRAGLEAMLDQTYPVVASPDAEVVASPAASDVAE